MEEGRKAFKIVKRYTYRKENFKKAHINIKGNLERLNVRKYVKMKDR